MKRQLLLVASLGLLSCVTESTGPSSQSERIQNLIPFDLINCLPPKLDLPRPVNEAILGAQWVAAQPRIAECLVDPKNRGQETNTKITVSTTVTDQGVDRKVAGTNLSPDGQKCIENVFAHLGEIAPLPKGHAPVSFNGEMTHPASSEVRFGANEASDVAGTIRLAEKDFCPCFEPWKMSPPHTFVADLDMSKGADGKTTVAVSFKPPAAAGEADGGTPALDATTTRVTSCLQGKVTALNLPLKSQQLKQPYPFLLINSASSTVSPDLSPNLQMLQLDGIRTERTARTALKLGARANSALAYDALVRKYQKNPRSVTVKELKDKCNAMLHADDEYKNALEKQVATEKEIVDAAGRFKFTEAQAASQKVLDSDAADLQKAAEARKADEKVCPRVTY